MPIESSRDAVIVATARSPIGRAFKGSLVDMRPDDLGALAVRAVLDAVPQLPRDEIEDLVLGCAQPAGEQGYNLGRVVALLTGLRDLPGTTVLSEETDPNKLHDLKTALDDHAVYTAQQVDDLVSLYLDGADRVRLDPILVLEPGTNA